MTLVWGDGFLNDALSFQNYLARNFYNLRFLALFVAFAINFILLFYKVSDFSSKDQVICSCF